MKSTWKPEIKNGLWERITGAATRRMQAEIRELTTTIDHLEGRIDYYQSNVPNYSDGGNQYRTRQEQVFGLIRKFNGEDPYGCELVQMTISLLAAFALPGGVDVKYAANTDEKTNKREMDFVVALMDNNNLNEGVAFDLAREAHLQGQVVLILIWDEKKQRVLLDYLPWAETGYKIVSVGKSKLLGPFECRYKENGEDKVLKDHEFVFLCLNDRLGKHEGRPRLASQLTNIEQLSRDLFRWDIINGLFANPTPYFECNDSAEAGIIRDVIQQRGWKAGNAFAGTAKHYYVTPDASVIDMLEKAIATRIKLLSGAVQIAVHLLGWADVMSNRSTAESMGEPTEIISKSETACWVAFFEDLFWKAIRMHNTNKANSTAPLDESGVIEPKLTAVSDRQWKLLVDFWLQAAKEGLIDRQTFLEQLPNLDVEEILKRLEEQDKKRADSMLASLSSSLGGGKTPSDEDEADDKAIDAA